MKKLWIYLLVLGAIIDLSLVVYINWPDNSPKLSYDEKFYASLKCPEDYTDEETRLEDNEKYIIYFTNTHPGITLDEMLEARVDFLKKKNCTETLKIWAENEQAEEDYYAEIERNTAIQEVSANSSSIIIKKQDQ